MKFLLALSVLASVSAFAQHNEHDRYIKCWDSAQEEGGRPSYVFKAERDDMETLNRELRLVRPFEAELENRHGCLVSRHEPTDALTSRNEFKICPTQGQRVRGLIPFEVEERFFEGTVYCERELKRYFEHDGGGHGGGNDLF